MSNIRPTLEKALPAQLPPTSWDSRELETKARKSILRRRFGGGIALAALALGAVLAVPAVMPGPGPGPAPGGESAGVEQPSFPLPELDDKQQYNWLMDGREETPATREISDAFWAYLDKHHPDLKPDSGDDSMLPIYRTERQLWTDPGGKGKDGGKEEQVYEQPVYSLNPSLAKHGLHFESNSGARDGITVDIYPKGGFAKGTADVADNPQAPPRPEFLVEGCETYEITEDIDGAESSSRTTKFDFSCTSPEASDGDELLAVERTATDRRPAGDHDPGSKTNTVVLYRSDGTAVVISDVYNDNKNIGKPTLDIGDLAEIAQALPDVTVE